MKIAPLPEGQPGVRDAPHELVGESQLSLIEQEEVVQSLPRGRARDDVPEGSIEELRCEAITEHCCMTQQCAIRRRQTVDAGGDEILECLRDVVERPEVEARLRQLEQEQRIATRPLAQCPELVLADLGLIRELRCKSLRQCRFEWQQLECARGKAQACTEALRRISRGQTRQPRSFLEALQRTRHQE